MSREVKANGGHAPTPRLAIGRVRAGAATEDHEAGLPAAGRSGRRVARAVVVPEQIAERLRIEFPDDPMMRVSHETIYQSLFVAGPGRSCDGSCSAVCAPAGRSAGPAAASRPAARSPAW